MQHHIVTISQRRALYRQITRRRLLTLSAAGLASSLLAACGGDTHPTDTPSSVGSPAAGATATTAASPSGATGAVSLDQFMQMSRVLTAFPDLNDTTIGQLYLDSLTAQRQLGGRLGALYTAGNFGGATPTSIADLTARGVYDDEGLATLADTITSYWYSGIYLSGPDQPTVATYTNAVAWQTLGYRPAGPSSCGGAFGYWNNAPAST
jgi:hypothetical protein